MKKIYSYLFAAVAILAAVACNKEIDKNETPQLGETVTFYATTEVESKTVLEGNVTDGFQTKWSTVEGGEWMRVLGQNGDYHFGTAKLDVTTTSATFTYTGEYNEPGAVLAVYPSNPYGYNVEGGEYNGSDYGKDLTEKKVTGVIIPKKVNYADDPFGTCQVPMVAYSSGNTLNFKHAATILKFTVGNTNVRGVTFAGNTSEKITGKFDVVMNADGTIASITPDATATTDYKELKAMDVEGNDRLIKDQVYYMSIAPTEFNNGYKVELQFAEGGPKIQFNKRISAKTLERNAIYNLGELKISDPAGTVYFAPNIWAIDGAWFSMYTWDDTNDGWTKLEDNNGDGVFTAIVPDGRTNVIFCRMKSSDTTTMDWSNTWNQTVNLTYGPDNCFMINTWNDGSGKSNGIWSKVE